MMINIIILGIIVSIIFYEITDISPGGIVVPGLMVMYVNQFDKMVYTVIVAIITYLVVKFISRYLVIFGKRRFVILILVSILINFLLQLLLHSFSINLLNMSIIGYSIAGIIANDMYRQGIKRTIPSLAIVIVVLELIIIVYQQLGV
ncbi:MAG TPA: poly-gamma-glutamate biosynthesis protein PgsC [Bacilli bacterium]|jgi:poly-gamma-glutamate biosynthesis protein PgsC/CapC|nr:poly-gamma-glutamate biosynthesis protein PgsC [Acholeplasmataceae bacterium]HNZ77896.1 poly-gamma-glutamate biosynthesis protein PgsC [Bacilli bacterium]HOD60961.1 poly-gamma-glutamate biosynthesis protein PgsC [Bacilli bacterium]HOH62037.1 poly-gamma-glutamate biosynthesis protein PgsC [Bacilli bacterium]HPM15329.1 poly-gamma-glutamate biosynthesis protein PgsC [Bacilli bacterium]